MFKFASVSSVDSILVNGNNSYRVISLPFIRCFGCTNYTNI